MQRKVCNEELHNLYFSPNIIGVIKIRNKIRTNISYTTVNVTNTYKILVIKYEVKKELGIPVH
jgi:hypothetical protein